MPRTLQETDVTIVARHLPSNTETTTGLSLITTVTEHTDLRDFKGNVLRDKAKIESDSEGSSEEGHHYSIIVSPSKVDETFEGRACAQSESDNDQNVNFSGATNTIPLKSTAQTDIGSGSTHGDYSTNDWNKPSQNTAFTTKVVKHSCSLSNVTNVRQDDTNPSTSVCDIDTENDNKGVSIPKATSFKRQKSVAEGTVYIDEEGYKALKALSPIPPKSMYDTKLKYSDEDAKAPPNAPTIAPKSSSQYKELKCDHKETFPLVNTNECETESSQNVCALSNGGCDKMSNQQNKTDESQGKDSEKSETNVCERKVTRISGQNESGESSQDQCKSEDTNVREKQCTQENLHNKTGEFFENPGKPEQKHFHNFEAEQTFPQNKTQSRKSETNSRKRKKNLRIEQGQILPQSFILARQVSQEAAKKVKYDTSVPIDEDVTEVTNEEIDEDIQQYIRNEDEVNLLKKLYAKK